MRGRSEMGDTWIEDEMPYDGRRRGRVRCADGKLRVVRLAQTADTFFTIPANDGRGSRGYVMVENEEFRFFAYPKTNAGERK